jgi:hypothetical protein
MKKQQIISTSLRTAKQEAIQCSLSFWIASGYALAMTKDFRLYGLYNFRLYRFLQPDGFAMTTSFRLLTFNFRLFRNDEQKKIK